MEDRDEDGKQSKVYLMKRGCEDKSCSSSSSSSSSSSTSNSSTSSKVVVFVVVVVMSFIGALFAEAISIYS